MKMNQCDIGLIGLAVMGENLVLNMESKGFHRRGFQSHHRRDGEVCRQSRQRKKHSADDDDGGICRRPATPAQSDDHGQGRRAGRRGHWSTRPAPGKRGCHHRRRQLAFHRYAAALQGPGRAGHSLRGLRCFRRRRGRAQGAVAHARWSARLLGNHCADLHQDRGRGRWRALLPLHGAGWRRPLRQDGAQRDRVRRYAVDLRSLRHPEQRPRPDDG